MNNLDKDLELIINKINKKIDILLPDNKFNHLLKAMRYSVLSGGKRLRAFFAISIAKLFNLPLKNFVDIGVAIEFIHTYSLIHDDLPSMDDDSYRRGKLSCHKKFTEATAILAGDSLLTFAFEILSNLNFDSDIKCKMINVVSKASGFKGMSKGQMIDLTSNNKILSLSQITKLHFLKTAKIFAASIELCAIASRATNKERYYLKKYGLAFGLAFQTKDDIEDYNKDKNQYINVVSVAGLKNSYKRLTLLRNLSLSYLHKLQLPTNWLKDITILQLKV